MKTCKDCLHYDACLKFKTCAIPCEDCQLIREHCYISDDYAQYCEYYIDKDEYQKVVHAKWIAHSRQKFTNSDVAAIDENGAPFIKMKLVKVIHYKCSSCNEIFDNNSLYCPDCGAKMDLE